MFLHRAVFRQNFLDQDISGESLLELGKAELAELGVSKLGQQLLILKAIRTARDQPEPQSALEAAPPASLAPSSGRADADSKVHTRLAAAPPERATVGGDEYTWPRAAGLAGVASHAVAASLGPGASSHGATRASSVESAYVADGDDGSGESRRGLPVSPVPAVHCLVDLQTPSGCSMSTCEAVWLYLDPEHLPRMNHGDIRSIVGAIYLAQRDRPASFANVSLS